MSLAVRQRFASRLRNRHLFLIDVASFLCIPFIAIVLRMDGVMVSPSLLPSLAILALLFTLIKIGCLIMWGSFRQYWQYASVGELGRLLGGLVLATIIQLAVFMLSRQFRIVSAAIPRSLPFLDSLLSVPATILIHSVPRLLHAYETQSPPQHNREPKRVLIIGAGHAGTLIAQEMRTHTRSGMLPVGFIDDDPQKHNTTIRNLQVLGGRAAIPQVIQEQRVDEIVIALPVASGRDIREIVQLCEQMGVSTRTIPSINEILDGKINISQLREIQIEDLLRRPPIQTDVRLVQGLLQGKRVLVTGGGGSIGSELCRQIIRCAPAELILLGHGENSIFDIQNELNQYLQQLSDGGPPRTTLQAIIADIRFAERVQMVFHEVRPEIVFHAAAHKHVPLMESNPAEAISNNICGTRNLLLAAQAVSVQHFVMISTDKAVNPTSIMGASKRVAELLVRQAAQHSGLPYVAVRFGNVLGSRGSVVHTFRKQIAAGGPVMVTDPEMKRYFMTIPEAVQLVLQAATLGCGGEVFMLDMGEPVKVVDLARDMIELSGLEVGCDIMIAFSGMRPGEKLFEELFIHGEEYRRTPHEKVFIAHAGVTPKLPHLDPLITQLEYAAQENNQRAIRALLQQLVPEYQMPDHLVCRGSANDGGKKSAERYA